MSPLSLARVAGRLPYDQAIERERRFRGAERLASGTRAGDPRPWISKLLFELVDATPMLADHWSFADELQAAARDRDMLEDRDD
jgi:hypothetical protein